MFPYDVQVNTRRNDFNYYKVIGADGDFIKKYGIYREIDTLINVLKTRKGSYPGDPEFGSNLHLYQFDEVDEITRYNIENEIRDIVATYLKNVRLLNIDITPYKDLHGFQIEILLQYGEEKENVVFSVYKGTVIAEF